jgi:hypothetical protein
MIMALSRVRGLVGMVGILPLKLRLATGHSWSRIITPLSIPGGSYDLPAGVPLMLNSRLPLVH